MHIAPFTASETAPVILQNPTTIEKGRRPRSLNAMIKIHFVIYIYTTPWRITHTRLQKETIVFRVALYVRLVCVRLAFQFLAFYACE